MALNANLEKLPSSKKIASFQKMMIAWYMENGREFPWRKKSIPKYQKIVSEVLLQRTRAETVATFFPAFILRFPSWNALATTPESEMATFIRPIGLWQRRASVLASLAMEMIRRNGRFPRDRQEIESLPGVGQYIANAIQLFCHGEPMPLLDVNMARVLERYFGPRILTDIRHDPYLQQLSLQIVNCDTPQIINWAILDLASLVCKARNPNHDECPLRQDCLFLNPVRSAPDLKYAVAGTQRH